MAYFGLSPDESCKTIFLFAGARGGSGKTTLACILLDWLRFRCSPSVAVRGFDLDPDKGLSRFYVGLERVGDFKVGELLGLIVADTVHSCFVIDCAGGSEASLRLVFGGYDPADLAFKGIQIVLVAPVTSDWESLKKLSSSMEFAGAGIVLAYRLPALGSGRQIGDLTNVSDFALPLWLEMCAGSPGGSWSEGGDLCEGQEGRIKRLIEPQFEPEALVEHLFSQGIPLYQAAYPYSAWARRELSVGEETLRRRKINALVGHYWGPRKKYWGVGPYFGHQLTVSLGFLYRQLADVFCPLIAGISRPGC